jgi:hypothetical protein
VNNQPTISHEPTFVSMGVALSPTPHLTLDQGFPSGIILPQRLDN